MQEFGEGHLAAVEEAGGVVDEAVNVRILSGENGGAAGSTDGVSDQAAVEAHAFGGETVNVGGLIAVGAVGTDGLPSVVVREDEDDVGRLGGRGR